MNPKVILDISLLGHDKAVWRGMERVAKHLFDGLQNVNLGEVSYVATSHLVGAYDFLSTQGISPDEKLRFSTSQLRASRIGARLSRKVHRSMSNRSLPARAYRRALADVARLCCAGESKLTPAMLRGVDIYHSPHRPFPMAVREAKGLRKFMTVHDFNPLKYPKFFPGNDAGYINDLLTCLTPENFAFCVSETVKGDILSLAKIPEERIFVTPLGADETIFHPVVDRQQLEEVRRRYNIPEGGYFLALSSHVPHKNFAHLIRCFGELVESGELTDMNLVIVGQNPQSNLEVRELLAKYPRAKPHIIVPGFLPDDELAAIYSSATAFLFPSLFEGFGIPPLEAMQCGTPVVASNTTSMPEVVGEAGILLDPKDIAAWCQAMLLLDRDPAQRERLSQKSLARAKLFSWEQFTRQTLSGYQTSLQMHQE